MDAEIKSEFGWLEEDIIRATAGLSHALGVGSPQESHSKLF
jgi:hypothetical protein